MPSAVTTKTLRFSNTEHLLHVILTVKDDISLNSIDQFIFVAEKFSAR